MKVKLSNLMNSKEVLQKLINEKLPITLSFKIAKILKVITPEIDNVEAQREKLIRELGEEVEGRIVVKKENEKEFYESFNKLLNEEVELSGVKPIKIKEFEEGCQRFQLSPVEIVRIDFILEE